LKSLKASGMHMHQNQSYYHVLKSDHRHGTLSGDCYCPLNTQLMNTLNTLRTSDFKPTTLTCALYTLKINIKSPNYFYELKFLGNTYQGAY
jgi:hypothetical protein